MQKSLAWISEKQDSDFIFLLFKCNKKPLVQNMLILIFLLKGYWLFPISTTNSVTQ